MAVPASQRYSRHVLFDGLGETGQRRIMESAVAIVGCGALGSAQAEMLARAGVAELRLIDRDFVDWSNLQRQSLFTEADARDSLPKAVALARELGRINAECHVRAEVEDFNASVAEGFLAGVDLVLDGTDNFQTRYLINDCSVTFRLPWIYGACVGSYGTVAPFLPGETPCLRCLFPEAPPPGDGPTCDTAGIVTPLPRWVASMQVAEALKLLSGAPDRINRAIVSVDLWENRFQRIPFAAPEPNCPCCGLRQFEFLKGSNRTEAVTLCGRNAVQILPARKYHLDLLSLQRRFSLLGSVTLSTHLLKLCTEDYELAVFPDGRAIVKGTSDPAEARSVYVRYIGD